MDNKWTINRFSLSLAEYRETTFVCVCCCRLANQTNPEDAACTKMRPVCVYTKRRNKALLQRESVRLKFNSARHYKTRRHQREREGQGQQRKRDGDAINQYWRRSLDDAERPPPGLARCQRKKTVGVVIVTGRVE